MPDWYRSHNASPDAYPESEYREWAQDNGLYVDAAGNVDYGPPDPDDDLNPVRDEPDFEAEAYWQHCDEAHGGEECDCPPAPPIEPARPGDPDYAERPPF